MSSPYLRPTQPDTLRDLQRRLDTLERNISRSMIVTPGVGIHIPGTLTVGNTPDTGGGGGAQISAGTPSIPTGFNSVAGADDENVWIDLTWAFPDGSVAPVAAFEVRWKRSADTDYQFATTSNSENYRINGLVGNTGYDTGIRSISTLGAASAWVTDTVTTGADAVAPAQVTGVVVATGNKTQMGTWDSNTESDLSHYLINVATSNSVDGAGKFDTGLVVDGEISFATVVTIDGLDGTGDTYYWQVAAIDRSGNQGTYSATASNTTVLIESAWISSLVADKITSGSIAAQTIELTNSASSIIQSETYSAGSLGWQITGDGNAEFNEVTVRGALEGATIDIGGNDSTSFHVDINGNMWLGAGTFASAPFRVANNGEMDIGGTDASSWHVDSGGNMWWGEASSYGGATIKISNSGSVDFTTGSFSGDITGGTIDIGTNAFQVNSSGQMFLGASTYATAPWRVDASGDMDIGGTDATSGHWDASGQLYIGNNVFGSAPFRVTSAGALTATDATLQTSTGGDRIEIGSQDIQFYDGGVFEGGLSFDSGEGAGVNLEGGHSDLSLNNSFTSFSLVDVSAPYFNVTTAVGAFVTSNTPPNWRAAGSINFISNVPNGDINMLTTSSMYIQTDDGMFWEDYSSGTQIADLTYASNRSFLRLRANAGSGAIGGALTIENGSSGTVDGQWEVINTGGVDYMRLQGGSSDRINMNITTALYSAGASGGRDVHVSTSSILHYDSSTAEHKQNIRDVDLAEIQAKLTAVPVAKRYEARPEHAAMFQKDIDQHGLPTQFGWTAEDMAAVFPEACYFDPDENGDLTVPVGIDYKRMVPLAFEVIKDLSARLDAAGL